MSDGSDRELTIFTQAAGLSIEQRDAFLAERCGSDEGLLRRVKALLSADAKAGDFLESPLGPAQEKQPSTSIGEKAGDKLGRYKLLQQIGEGGWGVVFMAEQEEPVRRLVALKVVKPGMDSKNVIARFEAERQALALMEHPNIASVFDAGATDSGRPYFVMELVRGIKITEYCDQHALPTTARLELFVRVCRAVQHAHQKGIIHRDLKPSNILVTTGADGSPLPKIIDFGIAKAASGQPLTDKTLFTAFEMLIGTPAYMSPEQATLASLDVDTRTDIYSLGVLLYELLTSTTPFDTRQLLQIGLDEIRRVIRCQEPVRPSTRLSAMQAQEITAVSEHRQAEPPHLIRELRGDLDWIVMKALEKDRVRRYQTANDLAEDVRRHLLDEAVNARPPSTVYRFQKQVARNKLAFAGIAGVLVSLLAGLGVALSLLAKEKEAREDADNARAQAERNENRALAEAEKSKQVTRFLEEMLQGVGPSVALGRDTKLLQEILDKTLKRMGSELADQPVIEAELLGAIGRVFRELGQYEKSAEAHRKAIENLRRVGESARAEQGNALEDLGLALLNIGKFTESEASFRECLAIKKGLFGSEHLLVASSLKGLSGALSRQGKLDEAEELARQALALRQRLLGNEHPDVADSLNALCVILGDRRNLSAATEVGRQALEIRRKSLPPDHPSIAISLYNYGAALGDEGKLAEAEAFLREALALRIKVFGNDHPEVGVCHSYLGYLLNKQSNWADAEPELRAALAIRKKALGEDHPDMPGQMLSLARALDRQAKISESEPLVRKALEMMRRNKTEPKQPFSDVALFHAQTVEKIGKKADAEFAYREALAMQRQISGDRNPAVMYPLHGLVGALLSQSKIREAEQTLTPYLDQNQSNLTNTTPLRWQRAEAYARQGKWMEAISDNRILLSLRPGEHAYYHSMAPLLVAVNDREAHQKLCREILARFSVTTNAYVGDRMAKDCLIVPLPGLDLIAVDRLADVAIGAGTNHVSYALFLVCKALSQYRQGHFDEAAEWARKSLSHPFPFSQAEAYAVLAMAHFRMDKIEEARGALNNGKAVFSEKLPKLESGDLGTDWRDWIIARALLIEAKSLIEKDSVTVTRRESNRPSGPSDE